MRLAIQLFEAIVKSAELLGWLAIQVGKVAATQVVTHMIVSEKVAVECGFLAYTCRSQVETTDECSSHRKHSRGWSSLLPHQPACHRSDVDNCKRKQFLQ